jgi:hypothetical protein
MSRLALARPQIEIEAENSTSQHNGLEPYKNLLNKGDTNDNTILIIHILLVLKHVGRAGIHARQTRQSHVRLFPAHSTR